LADPERHTVLWRPVFGRPVDDAAGRAERCDPGLLRIGVDDVLDEAVRRLEPALAGTATA
jgi:hypothetical protein